MLCPVLWRLGRHRPDRETRASPRAPRARDRRRGACGSASRSSSKRVTPPSSPSPKQPESADPGRSRARAAGALLRHQPGTRLRSRSGALRQSAERLLAAPARCRIHAAPARACRAVRASRPTASASRTPRPAPRRARAICARRTSTGAADRLAGIASELRPAWIGFVGKEAYRGAFGERPELGVQERQARRHPALRAAVDFAGERCGALGRAPALVSSARSRV